MSDALREESVPYSATPPPTELIDALYKEEVLRARRMSPEEKLLAGERLFEWACEIALAGIRHQFPHYSDTQCREALARRLALRRQLESRS